MSARVNPETTGSINPMEETIMKKTLLFGAIALLALSCSKKEMVSPDEGQGGTDKTCVFSATLPETKTYLGDKVGDAYPNYWGEGDAIDVNGHASAALYDGDGYVGTSSARFVVNAVLSAPYNAVYPASAVSAYDSGSATITIPANQTYIAGKYDPYAFILMGSSETSDFSFSPKTAIVKVTTTAPATGSLKVKSVKIEAIGDEKLSGAFATADYSTLTEGENNYVQVTPASTVDFGSVFYLVVPAQNYARGMRIKITASDDSVMAFAKQSAWNVSAGTLYPITAPAFVPSGVSITGTYVLTSSSIAIDWTGAVPANDSKKVWTIHVYTNSACTSELKSYTIPGGAACWEENQAGLSFAIGGLSQNTQYWFKVEDVAGGIISDAATATTTAFTPVEMPVSDISSTGVCYAEDFSEFQWAGNRIHDAGGFSPSNKSSFANCSTSGATFHNKDYETQFRSSDITTAIESSRLAGWLSEGRVYILPGYLKFATSGSSSYGFALTPEFPIEDGKMATVTVTLSAARYNADQTEDYSLCVISEANQKDPASNPRESDFTWPDDSNPELFRAITVSNVASSGVSASSWQTVTVSGLKLKRGERICFGREKAGTTKGNCRVYLNEISVNVTAIEDIPSFYASKASGSTSSTLVFTWTGDKENAYTATLYSDSTLETEVSSFDIPANDACWNMSQPTYVFGGLDPNTTYWFKVTDTTNDETANIVEATTEAFDIVEMPAEITTTGTVLAEDFGELLWGADMVANAAGFNPSSTSSFSDKTVSNFVAGDSNAGEKKFGNSALNDAVAASRLADWAYDSNVYFHCGNLKMGTANGRGWILTPQFTVPAGKKAVVSVTVTGAKFNGSQENNWGVAVLNELQANVSGRAANFSWPDGTPSTKYQTVSLGTSWTTRTVSGLEVCAGDRITFGARDGAGGAKGRVFVGDIKVEVTALEDIEINAQLLEKSSSTLAFTWDEFNAASDNIDNRNAYTATLYSDAGCTSEVLSYNFPGGDDGQALWRSGKHPKFIFAGLSANTTYYLKVFDTTNSKESEIIPAKTSPFTVVEMPKTITETGVCLAEDFSLFVWDFEYGTGSVGIEAPSSPSNYTDRTTTPLKFSESVGSYQVFTSSAFAGSRLNAWARDSGTDARVMVHPGYITLGSFSNNQKAWILTPEFPVQSGKVATATITITVRKGMSGAYSGYAMGILDNSSHSGAEGGGQNMKDANTSDFSWPNKRTSNIYNNFTVSNDTTWETKTWSGITIKAGDRLIIGSQASTSYSGRQSCLNVSDIKVEITAIDDAE